MKVNKYVFIADILFKRNCDGILLRCVDENQSQELIREFHEGICGGHFSPTRTTHKIIRAGFYWTSIFRDSYATLRKCFSCQQFFRKNEEICYAFAAHCGRTIIFPMGTLCYWAD
jgi:hypothetical protein